MFIQDKQTERIGFLHMEENSRDPMLYQFCLHPSSVGASEPLTSLYDYRMVRMDIGKNAYTFFGYPGLCFGGPSMGVIESTHTFVSVDYLNTITPSGQKGVWINALVSMLYEIGDVESMIGFIKQLSKRHIPLFCGYAIHIATGGDHPRLYTLECGDKTYDVRLPSVCDDRLIIAHGNVPENSTLYKQDEMNLEVFPTDSLDTIQQSIEFHRRMERLQTRAKTLSLSGMQTPDSTIQTFLTECAEPYGDIETNVHGKEYAGYVTPILAGFSVGSIDSTASKIAFHKLHPDPIPERPYRFWYDEHDHRIQDVGIDLLTSARQYSARHPVSS